jgi:hypothetical protein
MSAMSSPELEIARQQWQSARRRLEGTRSDAHRYRRLTDQVDALTAELRRRLGQTFTMSELVRTYRGSEAWTFDAIESRDREPGWEREAALVTDAAFDVYSRGASDYAP